VETQSGSLLEVLLEKKYAVIEELLEAVFYAVRPDDTYRAPKRGCSQYIEMNEANIFRSFMKIYSIFKSERLTANNKLTLQKTLIKSVMIYACSA
jgi:hypothetical protein